jgi:putative restriction endonuclease
LANKPVIAVIPLQKEIYSKLTFNHRILIEIAKEILGANFPNSIHEDILQAVDLDIELNEFTGKNRDPDFRERVLRAYEYRCAVCGFNSRFLPSGPSMIDY